MADNPRAVLNSVLRRPAGFTHGESGQKIIRLQEQKLVKIAPPEEPGAADEGTTSEMMIKTVPSMLRKPSKTPRGMSANMTEGRSWITDLVGKKYPEAATCIQFQHRPYRILQIDGICLANCGRPQRGEILLTLSTPENFARTSENTKEDQLRVGVWFSSNHCKSVVSAVSLTP
jgi:hypothetical protein